jgi:hypothetical protein
VLPVDFEKNGWHVYAGKEVSSTGRMAGMIIGPPVETAGLRHINRETAFDAYTLFALSDILFGPDIVDVPQSDWENANDHLIKDDMRLLRINLLGHCSPAATVAVIHVQAASCAPLSHKLTEGVLSVSRMSASCNSPHLRAWWLPATSASNSLCASVLDVKTSS